MDKIINLDEGIINALEFFKKNKLPKLNLNKLDFPIVVGSGNAYNTAHILFFGRKAIISSESTFKVDIKNYKDLIDKKIIKEVVIISASGEKDSVWEAKLAKKNKLKTILITCSPESTAAKIVDEVIVYPKIPEPYTYNISTYLGMILSLTNESPESILNFLRKIKLKRGFGDYKSFSFVLPDKFTPIAPMIDIKRSELFGPKVSIRAFSFGHARHAKFVVRDKKELVISFGSEKNLHFGYPESRWDLQIPSKANFAFIFSLSYYLVGKIQKFKPDYFKKNIKNYCLDYGPKAYGKKEPFNIIVE
jgi:hypothetical protein